VTIAHQDDWLTVHGGDCREVLANLPAASVQCVVTSPPYWGLRDYGVDGQLGLEDTPEEYVAHLVDVFRAVRRVLRPDGTLWLNLGDSYAAKRRGSDLGWAKSRLTNPGTLQKAQAAALRDTGERHRGKGAGVKEKDLIGIPWRVAFALQEDGWYLRSDIIWAKTNPMPESVTDRPTKAHEYLFLLTPSPRYFYDADAIREPAPDPDQAIAKGQAELGLADVASVRPLRDRFPSGWASGPGSHATVEHARGDRARSFARSGPVSELVLPGQTAAQHRADREDLVPSGRNRRSVWPIATQPYPGAHFATFPEALVDPCVLAGTSEAGCCASCGAPWVRIEGETVAAPGRGSGTTRRKYRHEEGGGVSDHPGRQAYAFPWSPTATPTLGWRSDCEHAGDPVPCVVLDPFAGTGTVAVVAQRLSRRAVLIDLNPEYLEQQLQRNIAVPLGLAEAAS
jgi:DNA modification methylase